MHMMMNKTITRIFEESQVVVGDTDGGYTPIYSTDYELFAKKVLEAYLIKVGSTETKLWLLSNLSRTGYDTYDSCVVAAKTEEEAKLITPSTNERAWCEPKDVIVEYLGKTDRELSGVVISSFNAG